MRKTIPFMLFVLMSFSASASHIVGGEIEMLHIRDFRYRINLIYYFDVANNPFRRPEIEEDTLQLFVFRKHDNKQMRFVTLRWLSKSRVPYTQPACSEREIVTDKLIYTAEINLSPEMFNDESGYYITWARCCRNYSILNIFSQDPNIGQGAGQTFYREFPPLMLNGVPFVNSSPRNFPALNDYACSGRPYYVDFAGIDDDGDSLAYSLVTPLSTVSVTPLPPPSPAPYPPVVWIPGFDVNRAVNGGSLPSASFPDLRITNDGFLTVTPRSLGLYVFAVQVDEFRNKKKIGETRRDFQMLVRDCTGAAAPLISGKPLTGGSFTRGSISVGFTNAVSEADRCIVVSVSDPDAMRVEDEFKEFISLKIISLNFKGRALNSMLPAQSTGYITNDGTIEFNICFPECSLIPGAPYQIGVIAFDDACSLPLSDTLKVEVEVEPPHNERAVFTPPDEVFGTLDEGESDVWPFEAKDADGDELSFFALTEGFSMSQSGMKARINSNVKGAGWMQGDLAWDAFCDIYDFTKRTDFTLHLLVDDVDVCDLNEPDTLSYHLKVILPPNNIPVIDTDLTANMEEVAVDGITRRIYTSLIFNVTGTDLIDNNMLALKMAGDGFNPASVGMLFPKSAANGNVTSKFTWNLLCSQFDLSTRDSFNIGFVVVDSTNRCRVPYTDSLVVKVRVLEPLNSPPQLVITNLTEGLSFENNTISVKPGNELSLKLEVIDDDAPKDSLELKLLSVDGSAIDGSGDPPDDYTFADVTGRSALSSIFNWTPGCGLFPGSVREGEYQFTFRYADNRCITAVADTISVSIKVKDPERIELLAEPANVFTPNGDGYNDYYSMERVDIEGNRLNILPPDNCTGVFQFVRIYNRWGETVFSSRERDFRWLGLKEAAGVYYYLISYSNREFKGTVSLRD